MDENGEQPLSSEPCDNDLGIIYDWLKRRLGSESYNSKGRERPLEDPYTIRNNFVEDKIRSICKELKLTYEERLLVTVRTSFRLNYNYLRPIYSYPNQLLNYLVQPSGQVPFRFEGPSSEIFSDLETFPSNITDYPGQFGAILKSNLNEKGHTISKDGSSEDKEVSTGKSRDPRRAFAPRIDDFWTALKNNKDDNYSELRDIANGEWPINCFFAGKNKTNNDGTSPKYLELDHLIAIYFKVPIDWKLEDDSIEKASNAAWSLFTGIDLISRIDSSLFELEGLQIVADLLREFSNNKKAPADKIAKALKKLKGHLEKHLVGRQGSKNKLQVFYLASSFEQVKDAVFFPHLDMYPYCYRTQDKFIVSSYQIAHKKLVSATKFLLHKYLGSSRHDIVYGKMNSSEETDGGKRLPASFHPDFNKLFEPEYLGTDIPEGLLSSIWKQDFPDQLHMVSHDRMWNAEDTKDTKDTILWKKLNRPSNTKDANNSIVAFVVEGEDVTNKRGEKCAKTFPHGVIAIESADIDAFSDQDVRGLRRVITGLSALIRQIMHTNSPLDYRSSIASTFSVFLPNEGGWGEDLELGARLIFAVQKLDGTELDKLCAKISDAIATKDSKSSEAEILQNYNLTPDAFKIVQLIKDICPGVDDKEIVDEKKMAEVVEKRKGELLTLLPKAISSDIPLETVDFLEACTENFAWAGFLSSLGRALGERVDQTVPTFNIMAAGYSASSMFMASVGEELRQVVKLSSERKLNRERENYTRYVRYRLVNAARIPMNGFAFDTRGKEGDGGDPEELAYGALVSDLVFGQKKNSTIEVLTLLSIVARKLVKVDSDSPNFGDMTKALNALFDSGMSLWKDIDFPEKYKKYSSAVIVRNTFRLPKTWQSGMGQVRHEPTDSQKITREKKRQNDLSETEKKFRKILNNIGINNNVLGERWRTEDLTKGEIDKLVQKIFGIIHGDLNARNLTWSGDLNCFFMIDFEHVGVHFQGADQFRLAVNLVVDLISGEVTAINSDHTEWPGQLLEAIDNGINYLSILGKKLLVGNIHTVETLCDKTLKKLEDDRIHKLRASGKVKTEKEAKEYIENEMSWQFSKLIHNLILSLQYTTFVEYNNFENSTHWNQFWGYVLFCSILKEFEYSSRAISINQIAKISTKAKKHGFNPIENDSRNILNFLVSIDKKQHYDIIKYFRIFTAAKLLYNVCATKSLK